MDIVTMRRARGSNQYKTRYIRTNSWGTPTVVEIERNSDSKYPKLSRIPFPLKDKHDHPYDYDPIVQYQAGHRANRSLYSDRILRHDWNRHNELCRKHFGNDAHYWTISLGRTPPKIEAFLRDWCNDPELRLVRIVEYCDQASGYPVWCFNYISEKA